MFGIPPVFELIGLLNKDNYLLFSPKKFAQILDKLIFQLCIILLFISNTNNNFYLPESTTKIYWNDYVTNLLFNPNKSYRSLPKALTN